MMNTFSALLHHLLFDPRPLRLSAPGTWRGAARRLALGLLFLPSLPLALSSSLWLLPLALGLALGLALVIPTPLRPGQAYAVGLGSAFGLSLLINALELQTDSTSFSPQVRDYALLGLALLAWGAGLGLSAALDGERPFDLVLFLILGLGLAWLATPLLSEGLKDSAIVSRSLGLFIGTLSGFGVAFILLSALYGMARDVAESLSPLPAPKATPPPVAPPVEAPPAPTNAPVLDGRTLALIGLGVAILVIGVGLSALWLSRDGRRPK